MIIVIYLCIKKKTFSVYKMKKTDSIRISYTRISPQNQPNDGEISLPFSFPSDLGSKLKPKKLCLNLSAERKPPQINTHLVSPRNQPNFIITPTELRCKASPQLRPHTTKYSQKHFDLNKTPNKGSWEDLHLPINPSTVIKMFSHKLPEWEKEEIIKFTNIYFIGNAIKPTVKEFDDENGDYNIYLNDHIGFRYEIIAVLGKGTFGQVIEVYDHAIKRTLAMKIIKNHRNFYEQALTEIEILKLLKENDRDSSSNIVSFEENFIFRSHIVINI